MTTTTAPAATRLQVLYATKGDKHIERIGGRNPDGTLWTMTLDEAVEEMKLHKLELFVHSRVELDFKVEVGLIDGKKYLRTHGDGIAVDNLLSLDPVPSE